MTRLFMCFQTDEDLPQAGDTVQTPSDMSGLDDETTIERIIDAHFLPDGRVRLTIDGSRREVPPSNVIQ